MLPWRWVPILLLLALIGFILLILVPLILELSNPKDEGPRQIPDATTENVAEKEEDEKT